MPLDLPAELQPLLDRHSPQLDAELLPPLLPRSPYDATVSSFIDDWVQQKGAKECVRVALHLANDDIPRAHELAQGDEDDMTSCLCHAILHRRESDFWNSKWWFDRIDHPVLRALYGADAKRPPPTPDAAGATPQKPFDYASLAAADGQAPPRDVSAGRVGAKRFVDDVAALAGNGNGGGGGDIRPDANGSGATTACGARHKLQLLKQAQAREMLAVLSHVLDDGLE